jgi:hypothetical protein
VPASPATAPPPSPSAASPYLAPPTTWTPVDNATVVASDRVSITISPGQTVVIEATTDLCNWCPLATNSFGAGPLNSSDPNPTDYPWRFYRARLQ